MPFTTPNNRLSRQQSHQVVTPPMTSFSADLLSTPPIHSGGVGRRRSGDGTSSHGKPTSSSGGGGGSGGGSGRRGKHRTDHVDVLVVLGAVLKAVWHRPMRPFSEVFQHPQLPQRDMYQYRVFVNLLWYARNYMAFVGGWMLCSGIAYPIMFANVCIFILLRALHQQKVKLKAALRATASELGSDGESEKEEGAAAGGSDRLSRLGAAKRPSGSGLAGSRRRGSTAASSDDEDAEVAGGASINSSSYATTATSTDGGLYADGSGTIFSEDSSNLASPQGSLLDIRQQKGALSESSIRGGGGGASRRPPPLSLGPAAGGAPPSPPQRRTSSSAPSSAMHEGGDDAAAVAAKSLRINRVLSLGAKVAQLVCCVVVVKFYGCLVPALVAVLPVMVIAAHSALTPYGDESASLFEATMAAKGGCTLVAPSTPVLSFEPSAFQTSREQFEREQRGMQKGAGGRALTPSQQSEVSPQLGGLEGLAATHTSFAGDRSGQSPCISPRLLAGSPSQQGLVGADRLGGGSTPTTGLAGGVGGSSNGMGVAGRSGGFGSNGRKSAMGGIGSSSGQQGGGGSSAAALEALRRRGSVHNIEELADAITQLSFERRGGGSRATAAGVGGGSFAQRQMTPVGGGGLH